MPLKIYVDPERRVRYTVATGVLTDADLLEAYGDALADAAYDPSLDQLVDATQVDVVEVSAAAVRRIAETIAACSDLTIPPGGHPRVAAVATSPAAYGMMRLYENLRSAQGAPVEYRVFRSLDEARRWLNLPEAAESPGAARL